MTQRVVKREHFDETVKSDEKEQRLYMDVMYVDSQKFLVTVSEPLQLTLQTPIKNVTEDELGQTLQGQLAILRERGFISTIV
jgi:hypothetical protein